MIRIDSTEPQANGNITEYHLTDGYRAWTVTEGKYTGFHCNCPEYSDEPGVGCRHITYVMECAKQERYLEVVTANQDEEIADLAWEIEHVNAAGHALALAYGDMAPYTMIIGDEAA